MLWHAVRCVARSTQYGFLEVVRPKVTSGFRQIEQLHFLRIPRRSRRSRRWSRAAQAKASGERTHDHQTVHDFATLLDHLATLTRNQLRAADSAFELIA